VLRTIKSRQKRQISILLILEIVLHVTRNSDFIDTEYLRDYFREGDWDKEISSSSSGTLATNLFFRFLLLFSFQPSLLYTVCAQARFHCDSCASCQEKVRNDGSLKKVAQCLQVTHDFIHPNGTIAQRVSAVGARRVVFMDDMYSCIHLRGELNRNL
jgi:hypothetical protein